MRQLPVSGVTSEQVAAYEPLIEREAKRFARLDIAEFDDLMQVGRIRVWKILQDDGTVTTLAVKNAMRDEMRRAGRLGVGGHEPILDDLDGELMAVDGSAL